MNTDQEQRQQALEKTKDLLAEGEKQRLKMRMSQLIEGFTQGDSKALLLDEFVSNVSTIIQESAHNGDLARAKLLLQKLESYACGDDIALRERAVMALSFCSGLLSPDEDYALLVKVSLAMAHWLKVEGNYLSVCDTVCHQLQRNGLRMLNEGHWQHFEPIQDILFQIYSGALEKGNVIRGLASRTLDGLAVPHILEEFVLVCQHGQGRRQPLAEKMLAHFGRRAVTFLLDKLLVVQQKSDRLYFLQLIPQTGRLPVPVLQEYLHKDLPWYGIRNIVALIAVWGDASHLPLVLPFLKHRDIRVQQQVIDCFEMVTGDEKRKCLFTALSTVHDALKVQIVESIGQLGCTSGCMERLLDLLSVRDSFAPAVHDELLLQLCRIAGMIPERRSAILLQQVLAERAALNKNGKDAVSMIAQRTLQTIESQLNAAQPPVSPKNNGEEMQVSFDSDPHAEQLARLNLRELDSRIEKLLNENKIEEATHLLADHAVAAAKKQDFITANILRDRMLAVNPNALLEVVRIGKMIEKESENRVDEQHLSLWRELHDFLRAEVFLPLYHSLSSQIYQPGDVVVQQGALKPVLYFINTGQVGVIFRQGHKETLIHRLQPGDIVGATPFFSASVWTVSLLANTDVKIQVLERDAFRQLAQQYPQLEAHLTAFCHRNHNVDGIIADLLRKSLTSRRQSKRFRMEEQQVSCHLLDEQGNETLQKFNGILWDISQGGFALLIRILKRENSLLFLGRAVSISLRLKENDIRGVKGRIVAVTSQDVFTNNYLVHVQLDQVLSNIEIKGMVPPGA